MAKGLYTNSELVDTIIVDLNNMLKDAMSGQFIQMCSTVTVMSQKLLNLKKTIDNDLNSRDELIENLKIRLKSVGQEIIDVQEQELVKDGETNGCSN